MNNLFDAISHHRPDEVDRLLLSGANPNTALDIAPYWFPLEAAIEEIYHDASPEIVLHMVQSLIRRGADVNAWNRKHEFTPLLKAIYFRTPGVVELLLESGADPNVLDQDGDTPLKMAIADSDLELARKLLERGATRTMNEPGGFCGCNALHLAVTKLNLPAAALLLEMGADPTALDTDRRSVRKRVPLETRANQHVRQEMIEMIDQSLAKLNR